MPPPSSFYTMWEVFYVKLGEGIFPLCERMVAQPPVHSTVGNIWRFSYHFHSTLPAGERSAGGFPPRPGSSPLSGGTLSYHHPLLKQ